MVKKGGEMTFRGKCIVLTIAALLILIACTQALAVHGEPIVRSDAEYPATPEKVVEEYVRKDAEGTRLSGDKFQEIKDLFMWEEAGFDAAIIITGYRTKALDIGPETARIAVTYQELGEFLSPDQWKPNKKESTTIFILKKDGNRWRIAEPEIFPMVSLDTMIAMFEHDVEIDPRDEDCVRFLNQLKTLKEKENKHAR